LKAVKTSYLFSPPIVGIAKVVDFPRHSSDGAIGMAEDGLDIEAERSEGGRGIRCGPGCDQGR
jgi:hypothetical protein